ncbi:Laminin subunit gamma-3, partial [Cricetulus griseus]
RPCTCNVAGSLDTCDPHSGNCPCKENVEGSLCDRCRPGTFNLQPHNPAGCSSCFCYGHSKVCAPAAGFQAHHILSDFHHDCRCSPLGAVSSQCHENSTCVCRPGFVGYKCDRCQDNFFLLDGDTGCQECPTCYALVKEELRYKTTAALTQASSSVQAATLTVIGATTLLADLEGTKQRFPLPKEQEVLRRRAGSIRARLLEHSKRKTKQAERMLGNAAALSSSAKKKSKEAELMSKDNAKLAKALLREGKQGHRRASRLASQTQATLRQASRLVLTSEERKQELEEAKQVASGLSTVERQIQESRGSLVKDVKVLSELLTKLGSLDTHQAPTQILNETQRALESLRQQLGSHGTLHRKLRELEQESARQELQIQSFENDLAEIRADKHNLETILSSLPEQCAS